MADYLQLAAQMRAQREQEQRDRASQSPGGMATTNGGIIGQGPSSSQSTFTTPSQESPQVNPLQQGLNAYSKYKDLSTLFNGGAGSSLGASGTAYAGSGLGGTGYGLGSSLVAGGGSGAGAGTGLGSMLGSYGGGSAAGSTGGFGALGSTTQGGLGAMLGGGGNAAGGSALGASGGAAGGSGFGGAAAGGGMLAGLAALSYLGDKEMNENKGSMINADKLNNAGTIGKSGIGIRFGDFANGFNPATWLSDPSKAAKGLGNAFTLGFLDKLF